MSAKSYAKAQRDEAQGLHARAAAATILFQVVDQGQSLSTMLARVLPKVKLRDHGLVQELCYGVLRWLPRFEAILQGLMEQPLKGKSRPGHFLLMVGLNQLFYMRIPAHAAVSETVDAAVELKLPNLKKLVNGVLRSAERQGSSLLEQLPDIDSFRYCHPSWLTKRLQAAYPEQWAEILEANNQHAPMWLRANALQQDAEQYLQSLAEAEIEAELEVGVPDGLRLVRPQAVTRLPGFADGVCSVQDGAAQLAAHLLDAQPGERVLDACAAPGGKTCHILELQPQLGELVAIDCDAKRLERVQQNLDRIGLTATLHCADACSISELEPALFDRILLDAPCSATGVIRRHPDIKWLRRNSDIADLVSLQRQILTAMWQQLKPGGVLLYATCSVLPDENSQQISQFLAETENAELVALPQASAQSIGWQLLPGELDTDGFYYAKLRKAISC